ncbi:hypothetical protein [Cellulomonas sp. P5_C5]
MDPAHALVDLPRRPAAVIGAVGVVVLVVTYALLAWNNVLEGLMSAGYGWPVDQATLVDLTVRWTLTVVLWCSVVWVASQRQARLGHPWRVPAVAVGVVAVWVATSWKSDYQSGLLAVAVPWPGPVPAVVSLLDPANDLRSFWALRPGIATPVLLAAAVTLVARVAARRATADGGPPPVQPTASARYTALVVLGPPAIAAVAAAVAAAAFLLWPSSRYGATTDVVLTVLADPGARLAVAIAAVLLLGGTGRAGWVLTGLVAAVTVGPNALIWWAGAPDEQLAAAALGALALALAAAVHPVAMALSGLGDAEPRAQAAEVQGRKTARPDLVQPLVGLVLALVVAAFAVRAAVPVSRAVAGGHLGLVTLGVLWEAGSDWAWFVGACLLLTWSATRGLTRRGSRFTAVPLVVALTVVVSDALAWHAYERDYRELLPYTVIDPGRLYGSPAWAFTAAAPFVVGAVLVVAWWLGRRVVPVPAPPRSALVPATLVVALPALAFLGFGVAVMVVAGQGELWTGQVVAQLLGLAVLAVLVLGFPLMASGGGRPGVVATFAGVLALPLVLTSPLSAGTVVVLAATGCSLSLVPLARRIERARSPRAPRPELGPVHDGVHAHDRAPA